MHCTTPLPFQYGGIIVHMLQFVNNFFVMYDNGNSHGNTVSEKGQKREIFKKFLSNLMSQMFTI